MGAYSRVGTCGHIKCLGFQGGCLFEVGAYSQVGD